MKTKSKFMAVEIPAPCTDGSCDTHCPLFKGDIDGNRCRINFGTHYIGKVPSNIIFPGPNCIWGKDDETEKDNK